MKKRIVCILILCHAILIGMAQNTKFRAKYLENAARQLRLDRLDTLNTGCNTFDHNGLPLTVIKGMDSIIVHIGYHLFAPVLRKEHPSPVYNYIEYAMLDRKCHFTENPLVYKDLKFVTGNWKAMESIYDTTAFEIGVVRNKYYDIAWTPENAERIEMVFPINYERLSLVNRRELEQSIIDGIRRYLHVHTEMPAISEKELEKNENGIKYKKGKTYLAPEINNNIYLAMSDSHETAILNSALHPVETFGNLCVAADIMDTDDMIDLTFIKYDYTQEHAKVKMRDFIGYMKSEGCTPYWGIENIGDDKIEGALFLYDKDRGYDHVLKAEVRTMDMGVGNATITATAYLFSPTTNVKDLHYQYEGKPKKLITK